MKKNILLVFLLIFLIIGCPVINNDDDDDGGGGGTKIVYLTLNTGPSDLPLDDEWDYIRPNVDWVFIVYMAGDNNLAYSLLVDLNEMELGLYNLQNSYPGHFNQIRIVAFVDNGYWEDTRVYEVLPDDDITTINSTLVANYDDLNSELGSTLTDFLDNVDHYFPASNYFLDISNHGDGARSFIETTRGAISDDYASSPYSYMYLGQISEAIDGSAIPKLAGIGFDCCLMATTEVAYEFRNVADYFVASMANESGAGWDYNRIFRNIQADTITKENFAIKIVDAYQDYHVNSSGRTDQTLSASNLVNINTLKTTIDALGVSIAANITTSGQKTSFYTNTRDVTTHFYEDDDLSIYYPYYDLKDFCDEIIADYGSEPDTDLETKAKAVVSALDTVIVKAYAGTTYGGYFDTDSRGLSIFISRGEQYYYGTPHYDTQWWYTAEDTNAWDTGFYYGFIDFCESDGDGTVETWRELFEYWYDNPDGATPSSW